jgi:hypothetical protein
LNSAPPATSQSAESSGLDVDRAGPPRATRGGDVRGGAARGGGGGNTRGAPRPRLAARAAAGALPPAPGRAAERLRFESVW